jgi:outer membrane protein assembly factor BamB
LYALSGDGTLAWQFNTGSGILSTPAIGARGIVYLTSTSSYLYAINTLRAADWVYYNNNPIQFSAAVGIDSTIYVFSG